MCLSVLQCVCLTLVTDYSVNVTWGEICAANGQLVTVDQTIHSCVWQQNIAGLCGMAFFFFLGKARAEKPPFALIYDCGTKNALAFPFVRKSWFH